MRGRDRTPDTPISFPQTNGEVLNLDSIAIENVTQRRFAAVGFQFGEQQFVAKRFGSERAIHPITPLDLGLFTVRRAAG